MVYVRVNIWILARLELNIILNSPLTGRWIQVHKKWPWVTLAWCRKSCSAPDLSRRCTNGQSGRVCDSLSFRNTRLDPVPLRAAEAQLEARHKSVIWPFICQTWNILQLVVSWAFCSITHLFPRFGKTRWTSRGKMWWTCKWNWKLLFYLQYRIVEYLYFFGFIQQSTHSGVNL